MSDVLSEDLTDFHPRSFTNERNLFIFFSSGLTRILIGFISKESEPMRFSLGSKSVRG